MVVVSGQVVVALVSTFEPRDGDQRDAEVAGELDVAAWSTDVEGFDECALLHSEPAAGHNCHEVPASAAVVDQHL